MCKTKNHITAAADKPSSSKTADLNVGFQCQLLRINVQKLLSKTTILDSSSPTSEEGIHNRKGRETYFSRQGSLNRPEWDATTRCCILNNGHSCAQWPIAPTAEWSHFNSSFSACTHPHLTQSNMFTPLQTTLKEKIKLTKTRCLRRVSTSKTLITHSQSITDMKTVAVSKTGLLL